ncbi:MAG TPA: hypothetical protein VGJ04_04460 [Pirellulales bacterium]
MNVHWRESSGMFNWWAGKFAAGITNGEVGCRVAYPTVCIGFEVGTGSTGYGYSNMQAVISAWPVGRWKM